MLTNRGKRPEVTLNLPLPVIDVTQASTIVTVSAEAHTLESGDETTGNFCLDFAPIASAKGDLRGRAGDTSLAFGGTALTDEIAFQQLISRITAAQGQPVLTDEILDYTDLLEPGEYYVVYETGRVYYKKADNTTDITADYLYRGAVSGGGGGGDRTVDQGSAGVDSWPVVEDNSAAILALLQNLNKAASSSSDGLIVIDNTVGGTPLLSANPDRRYALIQNVSGVDVYVGTGLVDDTRLKIGPGANLKWETQEAVNAFVSSGTADVKYIDLTN